MTHNHHKVNQLPPTMLERAKERDLELGVPEKEDLLVIRDAVYMHVSSDNIQNNSFQFDSDIYQKTDDGKSFSSLVGNQIRYVTEKHYLSESPVVGNRHIDEAVTKAIYKDLINHGKIPMYLSLFYKDARIRVKTISPIAPDTILGMYQGVYVPVTSFNRHTSHHRITSTFDGTPVVIDAENLTLSNWTRFLLPTSIGDANCTCTSYNNNIYIISSRFIECGEELITRS